MLNRPPRATKTIVVQFFFLSKSAEEFYAIILKFFIKFSRNRRNEML